MVRVLVLAAVMMVAAACARSPYNFPQPMLTPEGERGYSMTGFVTFTRSEDEAEATVRGILIDACDGPIEMIRLDMEPTGSAGVTHMQYEAIAACK